MSVYGSAVELIKLLEIYNSKDYVESKFVEWLDVYPDIIDIMLTSEYNALFDDAIRKNMDKILKKIIEENSLYKISELSHKYQYEIIKNIDVIFDGILDCKEICLDYLCKLVKLESSQKIILEKQQKILEKIVTFNYYSVPTDYTYNLLFLLSVLQYFSDEFINNNKKIIENILITLFNRIDPACYDDKDLLFLFEMIVQGCKTHEFINNFFNNHIEFLSIIFSNRKLNILKQEQILDFYIELIKDVMRIEKADITDMKLKKGANSRTFIIKDKVIKSGKKYAKKIPYHKRILQPIIRQSIMYENPPLGFDELELDYVEAYERTDDVTENDSSDDLVYKIFKEMLEDGVLWADPSVKNLGKLINPNIPFHEETGYNDEKFYIDDEVVGIFDSFNDKEVLDRGEIVIRDLDTLYYFKNLSEFIENKLCKNEKVNSYKLIEFPGWSKITYGPLFDDFLNKYIHDLKKQLKNVKKI